MDVLYKNVLLSTLAVMALSSCMVGLDFKKPNSAVATATFALSSQNQGVASKIVNEKLILRWWTLFNDPVLNRLQERALASNFDLKIAATRVVQSRAQLGVTAGMGLPKAGLSSYYTREALSENGPLAQLGAKNTAHDLWQSGFDMSWELDFWGYAARTKEVARASLQVTEFQRLGAEVSIAAEVARNYVLLRRVQTQIGITEKAIVSYQQMQKLTQSRKRHGVANQYDTASAGAELALVQAQLPQLKQQADQLMNALALLIGETPRALEAELSPVQALPFLPPQVPVGLPSELANRRPDILQAEANLHAATAAIGAATADFYPRIKLIGSVGVQALQSGDWGNWSSRQFNIGPTVYLPIFEGGRLKSTLALTKAKEQEAAIMYQQTVLRAWHEVDDAFNAYALEQQREKQLQEAVQQSKKAYMMAQRRYQAGATNYLNVLIAQNTLLSSQTQLNNSHADTANTMIALYKALGGGWVEILPDGSGG